jgi:hypothetical protein
MPRRLRREQGKRVLFGTLDTSTTARGGTRHGGFGRESILADDAALARAPFYSDTASDAHRVPTESIYGRNGGKKSGRAVPLERGRRFEKFENSTAGTRLQSSITL